MKRRRIPLGYRKYRHKGRFSFSNVIILLIVVAIALGIGLLNGSESARTTQADVLEVVDGDTIKVQFANGDKETIRLLGIDTPETHHPTKPVGCFGPEAELYSRENLLGRSVELEYDVERYDRYKRTLAYVYVDNVRFNDELVKNGYAKILSIQPNDKYSYELLQHEMSARKNQYGLWGYCVNDN